MKWLVVAICVLPIVFADPFCGPPFPLPEPECPPDSLPEPIIPVEVVGLYTEFGQNVTVRIAAVIQSINDLQAKNYQDLVDFIRETGGPGFNTCAKINFLRRQSDDFWQFIIDITGDLAWTDGIAYANYLAIIEKQFSLVINQPLVQSWMQELRQLSRLLRNQFLQAIQRRRAQWDELVAQISAQLSVLVSNGLCRNPDDMQERFNRILRVSFAESVDIIKQLFNDLAILLKHITHRNNELTRRIYEVDILALKYFVS